MFFLVWCKVHFSCVYFQNGRRFTHLCFSCMWTYVITIQFCPDILQFASKCDVSERGHELGAQGGSCSENISASLHLLWPRFLLTPGSLAFFFFFFNFSLRSMPFLTNCPIYFSGQLFERSPGGENYSALCCCLRRFSSLGLLENIIQISVSFLNG